MLSLIMYRNEKDTRDYHYALHSTLIIANDIRTLVSALSIDDLPKDCAELKTLMQDFGDIDNLIIEDVKKKTSELNLASVQNYINDVRKKLSFLNNKFDYYDK